MEERGQQFCHEAPSVPFLQSEHQRSAPPTLNEAAVSGESQPAASRWRADRLLSSSVWLAQCSNLLTRNGKLNNRLHYSEDKLGRSSKSPGPIVTRRLQPLTTFRVSTLLQRFLAPCLCRTYGIACHLYPSILIMLRPVGPPRRPSLKRAILRHFPPRFTRYGAMSILRTQSFFPFTLVLLVSLLSIVISVSRAQIVDHISQSTKSPSILVNDVVYPMNHRSTSTADPSSFLSIPTPPTQSLAKGNKVFGAVRVDISGRDDITSLSSSGSTISPSDLESSTAEPPTLTSDAPVPLLPSSTTPVSSESSSATSHDTTVPLSAVVGGAVGGSVVLIAFIVFIFVTRRQRRPRIEPFPFEPDVERHQPRERHEVQMSQHSSSASDVPIIRPPIRKQSHAASPHPLQSGTKLHAPYDHKVSDSATSLYGVPVSEIGRTFSHSCDAASVVSHDPAWRRQRPLPRPPMDKAPPVPDLPRDRPPCDNMPVASPGQPGLTVPLNQSLASSAPLSTPISPLDIDLGDYSNTSTSPRTYDPARRDSQLEPVRSPRRLPVPPVPAPTPPTLSVLVTPVESEVSLHFDADGRPDSPSVAKMYAELVELQRQVARLREDVPARHFGEAPPDYAEWAACGWEHVCVGRGTS
ncbi:hypothetical protein LXA43DRAFT_317448 [Ganoderma leucocontextum]|nr:hypothetical protein LXA43DRAFT_317448 [Ganoderma leucocontextum]